MNAEGEPGVHQCRQLTVISGKGGTGKTSLVGAFAALARDNVLADCDVDAADLHLLLHPRVVEEQEFTASKKASIDGSRCVRCGRCRELCRFGAISPDYHVDPFSCEGCGVCTLVCPAGAVRLEEHIGGKAFISETPYGPLCHAQLAPGAGASGKLVTMVRANARRIAEERGLDTVIIDGSPGIGCPVIASLAGADVALVVAEPTLSGVHDLKRVLGVTRHFGVHTLACVNKYNIHRRNTAAVERYCRRHSVRVVGRIPYDPVFTRAQVEGTTVVGCSDPAREVVAVIRRLWHEVDDCLRQ